LVQLGCTMMTTTTVYTHSHVIYLPLTQWGGWVWDIAGEHCLVFFWHLFWALGNGRFCRVVSTLIEFPHSRYTGGEGTRLLSPCVRARSSWAKARMSASRMDFLDACWDRPNDFGAPGGAGPKGQRTTILCYMMPEFGVVGERRICCTV
jgi:hypothetical protein